MCPECKSKSLTNGRIFLVCVFVILFLESQFFHLNMQKKSHDHKNPSVVFFIVALGLQHHKFVAKYY